MNGLYATADDWNRFHGKRIIAHDKGVINTKKFSRLTKELYMRPYLAPLKKLEIGCGPAWHIWRLSKVIPDWGSNYLGVDISATALDVASEHGLRVIQENVLSLDLDEKFELFLLLDVLEHIDSLDCLSEVICRHSASSYNIFGNSPLFKSEADLRIVDIRILTDFMNRCRMPKFTFEVWDTDGWPFIMFEGHNG